MELRQLEYFVELCRVRNFTRAADNLRVAQPSVTKAIHHLERELGVQLVDRKQKPLGLTKAGEQFYLRVKSILAQLEEAVDEVSVSQEAFYKVTSLGISPMSGAKLKQMLNDRRFFSSDPLYNLVELSSGEICKRLTERKLDLGWLIKRQIPDELEYIPLETQEAVLLLPAESPLRFKEKITFDDLKDQTFCMDFDNTDSVLIKIILDRCREAGFKPRCNMTTMEHHPNAQLAVKSVRGGLGLAFIPEYAVEQVTDLPVLSVFPPLTIEVGLAYRKDARRSGSFAQLVEMIKKEYPAYIRENCV